MSNKIDPVDREIIKLLLKDGRMSNTEIARHLEGVSERVVRYRIGKLIKEKVIRVSAVVDPGAIGFPVVADVWVEVEAGHAIKVAKRLAELDLVRYVSYSAGGMKDVTAQVVALNVQALYTYVDEVIGNVPGVQRTQTMLIPDVLKDVNDWVPPDLEANQV
ncbi:MAG: Lrp/AsnC family transcriptional regulator [Anaerolineae bacterium]|nr:Lrp/AsnC family transcriptional regulator [Anaerolineae bacterium]